MDKDIVNKIVEDALKHDEKLNLREIKIIEDINKNLDDLKSSLDEFKTLLDKIKNFNYEDLRNPLPKDEEYKIFYDIIREYNKISKYTEEILEKLLEYKDLLDKELY